MPSKFQGGAPSKFSMNAIGSTYSGQVGDHVIRNRIANSSLYVGSRYWLLLPPSATSHVYLLYLLKNTLQMFACDETLVCYIRYIKDLSKPIIMEIKKSYQDSTKSTDIKRSCAVQLHSSSSNISNIL